MTMVVSVRLGGDIYRFFLVHGACCMLHVAWCMLHGDRCTHICPLLRMYVEQAEVTPSKKVVALKRVSLAVRGLRRLPKLKVAHERCEFGEEVTAEFCQILAVYCGRKLGGLEKYARLAGMEEKKVGKEAKVGMLLCYSTIDDLLIR